MTVTLSYRKKFPNRYTIDGRLRLSASIGGEVVVVEAQK